MRYSIAEAAAILGISERTLHRRVKKGDIQVEKEGRRTWVILEEEGELPGGRQMAATVSVLPDLEGAIAAAVGPLDKQIRSLTRQLRQERKAHEEKVEELNRAITSLAREYGQMEERVALLTAPGAQPSWVQRVREWWGRRER